MIGYRTVRSYNFNKDVELKANSIIQRMTSKPERIDFSGKKSDHFVDIGRFYAAISKADAQTYRVGFWNVTKLKNEYATTEKLKIAGQKTARKLFYEAGLDKEVVGSKTSSFLVDKFAIKHPKVYSVLEAVMSLPAAVLITANSVHKQNVINAKYYDEAMKTKIEDEKKSIRS